MTSVQFTDGNAVVDAIADLRNDSTPTNWVLAKHTNNEINLVELACSGSGGVQELLDNLSADSVMYGLVRETEQIDLSTTVKFVYIYFVGEEVPFAKRGRIGIVQGDVKRYFSPFHIDFEITRPDEISPEILKRKIAENSGRIDNVRENVRNDPLARERGFTSSSTNAPVARKNNFGYQGQTPSTTGSVNVVIHESLTEAIRDVRDDRTETRWCIGKYEDDDVKKPVVFVDKGNGGVDEFINYLIADTIAYALVRVTDVIEGISTVKFVFINYIGSDVGVMKKAKISTHKGGITSAFGPFHVDFDVSSPREISDDIILHKVASNSGSKSKVRS